MKAAGIPFHLYFCLKMEIRINEEEIKLIFPIFEEKVLLISWRW